MIILRQKIYSRNSSADISLSVPASSAILGAAGGTLVGATIGSAIDDKIRYIKAKKKTNIENEKAKIRKEIEHNNEMIRDLNTPEMKKMQKEMYEFDYDPETYKKINRDLKKELELAERDPKEFFKRRVKKSSSSSLVGAGIGAGLGGVLGGVGSYKLAKKLIKK